VLVVQTDLSGAQSCQTLAQGTNSMPMLTRRYIPGCVTLCAIRWGWSGKAQRSHGGCPRCHRCHSNSTVSTESRAPLYATLHDRVT